MAEDEKHVTILSTFGWTLLFASLCFPFISLTSQQNKLAITSDLLPTEYDLWFQLAFTSACSSVYSFRLLILVGDNESPVWRRQIVSILQLCSGGPC